MAAYPEAAPEPSDEAAADRAAPLLSEERYLSHRLPILRRPLRVQALVALRTCVAYRRPRQF